MDMKQCAAIALSMHVLHLREYNSVLYEYFYWKTIGTNARKNSGKF